MHNYKIMKLGGRCHEGFWGELEGRVVIIKTFYT